MKSPTLVLLALVSCLFIACNQNTEVSKAFPVIPKPTEVSWKEGSFSIKTDTRLTFESDISANREELIIGYLKESTGFDLVKDNNVKDRSISFQVDSHQIIGYQLAVNAKGVQLIGDSEKTLLQGVQTLRQLIMIGGNELPQMSLSDQPQFQWRGMLLDCSRHFMEKDFVKRYIDLLALYKMNVLHWHITEDQGWRIQIDQYPKLTEIGAWRDDGKGGQYGGFYTKDDIREVVEYASVRGIEVIPEIELPGHSQAALAAYPQFSCTGGPFEVETEWGVFKEIYCAGNDSTFVFLEDVLTEVMELFPSEYIHIGGDEVPKFRWEQCPKCQRRIAEEGLHDTHELQSYFINRIGGFLRENGKQIIGWDEIMEGGTPEGAIVQSWRGFEGAKEAIAQGHQTIVSPTSHAYFDYGLNDIDLEKVYSFNPIPEGTDSTERPLVLGGECNMWSERAPQHLVDQKVFPRILAMAEVLWSGSEKKDFEEFRERVGLNYRMLDKLDVSYGFETVPVSIKTNIVDGDLYASLTSYDDDMTISYTVNQTTDRYSNPVKLNDEEKWAITFERNGSQFNDTIYQRFSPHLANGLIPQSESQYNKNYTAGGLQGLTDGKKGSHKFRDGNWQGYWGNDVTLTIDLGEERTINQLSAGFLQYNNAWIFFPQEVTYSVSNNGNDFRKVGNIATRIEPKSKKQETQEFTVSLEEAQTVRYVRVNAKNLGVCPDWHDAAGSDAWLFIDEFSVK